jgi:hypothetical protein
MSLAPNPQAQKPDKILALSIGARIKLDPWSDQIQLLKSNPATPISSRDKMSFELTPFVPFLTRYGPTARAE